MEPSDQPTYHVMYSGNAAVFNGMVSSVLSLVKFNSAPIHVLILTMDLSAENPVYRPITPEQGAFITTLLQKVNPHSTCRVIDMTAQYCQNERPHFFKRFTPYSMLRLYVDLIPDLPDKILYLDTDTLILDDLTDLFATDISTYEFAACRDRMAKWVLGYNYCNSGVLLLNLPAIRDTRLLERARQMCTTKKLCLADQTALNRCAIRKLILPPRYNRQRRINRDAAIRHYCASWRLFPYIHVKTVKQWQTDLIFKDKYRVYNNPTVSAVLHEYLALKDQIPTNNA